MRQECIRKMEESPCCRQEGEEGVEKQGDHHEHSYRLLGDHRSWTWDNDDLGHRRTHWMGRKRSEAGKLRCCHHSCLERRDGKQLERKDNQKEGGSSQQNGEGDRAWMDCRRRDHREWASHRSHRRDDGDS